MATGLVKAFGDDENQDEEAWRTEPMASRPKGGTTQCLKATNPATPANRAAPAEKEGSPSMTALTTNQVSLRMKAVPDWSKRAQTILRTFKFEGFLKSIDFVNRIARKAQKMNHHPDIVIRFNKVTLKLTTHDKGGLTGKDFALARQCDEVFSRYFLL